MEAPGGKPSLLAMIELSIVDKMQARAWGTEILVRMGRETGE